MHKSNLVSEFPKTDLDAQVAPYVATLNPRHPDVWENSKCTKYCTITKLCTAPSTCIWRATVQYILSVCIQHFRDWRWTFLEEIELSLGWPADISMCSRLLLVAATAVATASRSLAQGTTQVCCTFAKFLSQTVLKWCVPRKNYCDETIFFPLSSWLATFLVW